MKKLGSEKGERKNRGLKLICLLVGTTRRGWGSVIPLINWLRRLLNDNELIKVTEEKLLKPNSLLLLPVYGIKLCSKSLSN